MRFSILLLLLIITALPVFSTWNASWPFVNPITINSTSATNLTDFPVRVDMNTSNSTLWNTTTCTNVRFIDATNTTSYSYDLDNPSSTYCGNETNNATFWIKIPSLANLTVNTTILAYLGNLGAGTGENETNTWTSYTAVLHFNDNANDVLHGAWTSTDVKYYNVSTSKYMIGGAVQYVNATTNLTNTTGSLGTATFTMSVWCNMSGMLDNNALMNWQTASTSPGFTDWFIQAQNSTTIQLRKVTQGVSQAESTPVTIGANPTGHFAMTSVNSTGNMVLYVNGTAVTTWDQLDGYGTAAGGVNRTNLMVSALADINTTASELRLMAGSVATAGWIAAEANQTWEVSSTIIPPTPTTGTPVIAPNPASNGDELNCSVVCTQTTDDLNLKANFTWYFWNTSITAFNTQVSCENATACHTTKNMTIPLSGGEEWTCSAICSDTEVSYSPAWKNATITISGGGSGCDEEINITKVMDSSAFTNQTDQNGCVVNLDISIENASQTYSHSCSVGGTSDVNDTYDYCQVTCNTTALAACTYNPLALNASNGDTLVDAGYPCDLDISAYTDTVIDLTKTMTSSSFSNSTNVSGCAVNLDISVADGSQSYTHACSAGGTIDTDTTYDYCEVSCVTSPLAACTYNPYETQFMETILDTAYPCNLNITRNETVNVSSIAAEVWSYSPARTLDPDVWTGTNRSLTSYNEINISRQVDRMLGVDTGFTLPDIGGLSWLWPVALGLIGLALLGTALIIKRRSG